MHRHPVCPTGVLLLVFFDLLKVSKIIFDLFKVSKINTKFLTCSKSAKILRSSHLRSSHPRSSHPRNSHPKEQPSQKEPSQGQPSQRAAIYHEVLIKCISKIIITTKTIKITIIKKNFFYQNI